MSNLAFCRWREEGAGGALWCHSARFVGPPNPVAPEFCRACYYRDHEPAAPPRAAVATLYTPEIAALGRLTSGVVGAYARRHGYEAVIATERIDMSRPPSWSKLLLVERHLARNPACEWVMWIDADAVIVNPATRLEDFIDGDVDFLVAEDCPPSPINLGVFLVRNCPASLDLLRRAYAKVQYISHAWWEQPAVAEALRESGPELRARIVPRSLFNAFASEHQEGEFIIHFAGWSPDAKLAGVKQAVAIAWARMEGNPIVVAPPVHHTSIDLAHNVFLSGCVLSKKPDRVLELGIGPGYSSWALVRALAYNGKGTLTCVDALCDWGGREPEHVQALRRAGVEVVIGSEEQYVKSCPSESFDILVSDADHGHSHEWLHEHLRVVKPNGFLLFHDTNNVLFPNLRTIVRQVAHLPHYHFTESSRADENCTRGFLFVIKPCGGAEAN